MPKCEGNCEKHVGPVQRVHVWDGSHDWGEFWYCQAAIAEDRKRGFTVEIIGEKGGNMTTKKEAVIKNLKEAAVQDTDWSWFADQLVHWLLNHPDSETMEEFVDWIGDRYIYPDEYGETHVWDFFFGWGDDLEHFISSWFDNPEEAEDFRQFCRQR